MNLGKLWPIAATVIIIGGAAHEYAHGADVRNPVYKAPAVVAAPAAPFLTGWYLGAFVGYGQGNHAPQLDGISSEKSGEWTIPAGYGQGPDIRRDGMVLGGQIGYDVAFDQRWRIGLVTDIAWSNIGGTAGVPYSNAQLSSKMTWLGNFDVRVAYLLTPGAAIYGIGGLSVAGFNNSVRGIGYPSWEVGPFWSETGSSNSDTKWGWNIGAGFEAALDNQRQWSVFIDGRYFKFSDSKHNIAGYLYCEDNPAVAGLSSKNEYSVFRVGLNWHPNNR